MESLAMVNLPSIERRDSAAGEQAYIEGSSLAVWEVILVVRSYAGDLDAVAKHLAWPLARVEAAVEYAKEFPHEVDTALRETAAMDFESLQRILPGASEFRVHAEVAQ